MTSEAEVPGRTDHALYLQTQGSRIVPKGGLPRSESERFLFRRTQDREPQTPFYPQFCGGGQKSTGRLASRRKRSTRIRPEPVAVRSISLMKTGRRTDILNWQGSSTSFTPRWRRCVPGMLTGSELTERLFVEPVSVDAGECRCRRWAVEEIDVLVSERRPDERRVVSDNADP